MRGITFGEKHSWKDFGLYMKTRPVVSPPKQKTYMVDIPGADGRLDLSTRLTGRPVYDMRTITCEFVVIGQRDRWDSIYSDVQNYLHGQTMRIIMDDDPTWYYEGVVSIDKWASSKKTATISIKATVKPYKVSMEEKLDQAQVMDWLLYTLPIESTASVKIDFYLYSQADGVSVQYNGGKLHPLENMAHTETGIKLKKGDSQLRFEGNGVVTMRWREVSL